jgi:hypothetical protein
MSGLSVHDDAPDVLDELPPVAHVGPRERVYGLLFNLS